MDELHIDDVIARMEADELVGATKATPIGYARMRGMRPQMMYYYMRIGQIKWERCDCGRKVVDVEDTDAFFRAKGSNSGLESQVEETEEESGS
jgi:hypothetical protein